MLVEESNLNSPSLPGIEKPYTNTEELTLRRFSLLYLDPSLDLIVRSFLKSHADVTVSPVNTGTMTGLGTQAINDIIGTGAISARQYAQRNQKIQTQAVEWLQWKQWALSHKDFEKYRQEFVNDIPVLRKKASQFLVSDMGQRFLAYETFPGRGFARTVFVVAIFFGNLPCWIAAWFISKHLENTRGLTIVEWLMERVLGKPSLVCGPLKGRKYSERIGIIRDFVINGCPLS